MISAMFIKWKSKRSGNKTRFLALASSLDNMETKENGGGVAQLNDRSEDPAMSPSHD